MHYGSLLWNFPTQAADGYIHGSTVNGTYYFDGNVTIQNTSTKKIKYTPGGAYTSNLVIGGNLSAEGGILQWVNNGNVSQILSITIGGNLSCSSSQYITTSSMTAPTPPATPYTVQLTSTNGTFYSAYDWKFFKIIIANGATYDFSTKFTLNTASTMQIDGTINCGTTGGVANGSGAGNGITLSSGGTIVTAVPPDLCSLCAYPLGRAPHTSSSWRVRWLRRSPGARWRRAEQGRWCMSSGKLHRNHSRPRSAGPPDPARCRNSPRADRPRPAPAALARAPDRPGPHLRPAVEGDAQEGKRILGHAHVLQRQVGLNDCRLLGQPHFVFLGGFLDAHRVLSSGSCFRRRKYASTLCRSSSVSTPIVSWGVSHDRDGNAVLEKAQLLQLLQLLERGRRQAVEFLQRCRRKCIDAQVLEVLRPSAAIAVVRHLGAGEIERPAGSVGHHFHIIRITRTFRVERNFKGRHQR